MPQPNVHPSFHCFCGARLKGKPGFTCRKRPSRWLERPLSPSRRQVDRRKDTRGQSPLDRRDGRGPAPLGRGHEALRPQAPLRQEARRRVGHARDESRALRAELAASDPEALARLERALSDPTSTHSIQLAEAKRALDAIIRRLT